MNTMDDVMANLIVIATQLHSQTIAEKRFRKGKDKIGLKVPYIIHPLQLLYRIQQWGIVERTDENFDFWKAVLFHDTIEDTAVTYHELVALLGEQASKIVVELTKDDSSPKGEYIQSFTTKSIESLVAKVADRLSNTHDFMWQNPKYAKKYFTKSNCLFEVMENRKQEICHRFNKKVWEAMKSDYEYYRSITE